MSNQTYLQDLQNDFDLSSDESDNSEENSQEQSNTNEHSINSTGPHHNNDNVSGNSIKPQKATQTANEDKDLTLDDLIARIGDVVSKERNLTAEDLTTQQDLQSVHDIQSVTNIQRLLDPMLTRIGDLQKIESSSLSDPVEYQFLVKANEFSSEINNEIVLVHNLLVATYSPRFPELSTIVPDPIDFARCIILIGNDLQQVQAQSAKLKKIISNEKVLVLNMSVLELNTNPLPQQAITLAIEAASTIVQFYEARIKIMQFVSSRISKYAPNLAKIVGSQCAVQLMSYLGGLEGLTKTPSCNISSIGSKRPVSIGFGQTGTVHRGFLYHSPLLAQVPESIKKQAMRIVAAKIVLAARVDYGSGSHHIQNDSIDSTFADKTLKEIHKKFDKLLEPPGKVGPKALPIPIDKPSKKRGGRRFRKFKQQFEMSELQKAQNRMAFGQEEHTIVDAFGEEVGLGLAGRHSLSLEGKNNKQIS